MYAGSGKETNATGKYMIMFGMLGWQRKKKTSVDRRTR
jgi:hypothetical protein